MDKKNNNNNKSCSYAKKYDTKSFEKHMIYAILSDILKTNEFLQVFL